MQLLLGFRENIESEHQQQATDLGLSQTELSFYNILITELGGEEQVNDTTAYTAYKAKEVVQSLVKPVTERFMELAEVKFK